MEQAELLRQDAESAYQAEDYAQAEELYTQLLAMDPTDPTAIFRRGFCRGRMGTPESPRVEEAATCAARAMGDYVGLHGVTEDFFSFAALVLAEARRLLEAFRVQLLDNQYRWTNTTFDITPDLLSAQGTQAIAQAGQILLTAVLEHTRDFGAGTPAFFSELLVISRETLAFFVGDYQALSSLAAPLLTRTVSCARDPALQEARLELAALIWWAPCLEESPERQEFARWLLEKSCISPDTLPAPTVNPSPATRPVNRRRKALFLGAALVVVLAALLLYILRNPS